ncbi:MAG: hypothetical protein HYY06_20375 [Deltaproteobacteria bacterium]|nr:hypothetical protein [Deltaproteobacteria bacterium]
MGVIEKLSSSIGTRTQEANVKVARTCLADPRHLEEIAEALAGKDARLAGDCAEVMTKVAQEKPELVAPHAGTLLAMLDHLNGRVRWESAHALALVSSLARRLVRGALPRLGSIVRRDESVIVRDYVLDTIATYGGTGPKAAVEAFPLLCEGLDAFNSKHAARVLAGLEGVARAAPRLSAEIRTQAVRFEGHHRPGIRKAARSLLRSLGSATA